MSEKDNSSREKKKRFGKTRKVIKTAFLVLVLLSGLTTGLLAGGGIYVIADRIAPWAEGLPLFGEKVFPLLERISPPLTGYERRMIELDEKEKFIEEKADLIKKQKENLEKEKRSLSKRKELLENNLKAQAKRVELEQNSDNNANNDLFDLVSESFTDMPAGKAARIISLLPLEETASILKIMDSEQRSELLEKMQPDQAAKIVRFASFKAQKNSENQ